MYLLIHPKGGGIFRVLNFRKGVTQSSFITGHKDTKMLMRYTHLRAEDLVGRLG